MAMRLPSDSGAYILAAGLLHQKILKGGRPTAVDVSDLGPLSGMIVEDDDWRSPTFLHQFLAGLLTHVRSRGETNRRGVDVLTLVEVAGRVWGVSCYPQSRREVAAAMSLGSTTIRSYLDQVSRLAGTANCQVEFGETRMPAPATPFQFWSGRPADWCTDLLVEKTQMTMRAQGFTVDQTMAKRLLQRAAIIWLDSYLPSRTVSPDVWGYYYHHLRQPWEEADPLWPGGGGRPREIGRRGGRTTYHLAVAAAAQIACESVSVDHRFLARGGMERRILETLLNSVASATAVNPLGTLVTVGGTPGRILGASINGDEDAVTSSLQIGSSDLATSLEAIRTGTAIEHLVHCAIATRSASNPIEKDEHVRMFAAGRSRNRSQQSRSEGRGRHRLG